MHTGRVDAALDTAVAPNQAARYAYILSVVVLLIGSVVMAGWLFDVDVLKSVVPGRVSMKFNTALGLSLAALAVLGSRSERSRAWRVVATMCAVTIMLLGGVTLLEYVAGWTLGLDNFLVSEPAGATGTTHPGRMSPQTATNFVLFGVAYLFSAGRHPARLQASRRLLGIVSLVALTALAGHLYGAVYLYGISRFTGMAIHTAVAFLMLSLSLFYAQQDRSTSIYFSPSAGGVTARRLLPIAILLPLLLGWFAVVGERQGLYDGASGEALLIVLTILSFTTLIGLTARRLDAIDAVRRSATEAQERLITDLQRALSEVQTLRGLLPMCAWCKRIRDDTGYWQDVAKYVSDHTEADVTHGICPDCAHKHFPE